MRRLPLFIVLAVALSAQAQDYTKLSAHLSQLVRQQPSAAAARGPLPHPILTLMTTTDGLSATTFAADYGCQVVDSIGRIYIVSIPLSQVAPLSMDRRVERIEAERMPRPAMDVTPGQVNATQVYAGTDLPQAFTGRGVAAGVFDCGFDFTHPAFLDAEGNLRAKYYYNFLWPNDDGTLGHALQTTEEIAEYGHSQHELLGGGIEGTIIFRTDSIDSLQGDTCRLSTTVSMGQVQLNITKSDYQDPRGNVYHVDGLMPHTDKNLFSCFSCFF